MMRAIEEWRHLPAAIGPSLVAKPDFNRLYRLQACRHYQADGIGLTPADPNIGLLCVRWAGYWRDS